MILLLVTTQCALQTSRVGTSWELVRNAESQVPPRICYEQDSQTFVFTLKFEKH